MSSIWSLSSGNGGFRPPVTGSEVLSFGDKYGIDAAFRLLAYGESCVACHSREISTQAAAIRVSSSSGSASSRPGSPAGLTGTRLDSIKKVDNWRNQGVVAKKYPDGLCYTKVLHKSRAEVVASKVGEWPTFGSLVRLSADSFLPISELRRFRLVEKGDGLVHVKAGGLAGVSFLDEVCAYASHIKAQPGTLAASVQGSVPLVPNYERKCTGKTRVGGSPGMLFDRELKVSRSELLIREVVPAALEDCWTGQFGQAALPCNAATALSLVTFSADTKFHDKFASLFRPVVDFDFSLRHELISFGRYLCARYSDFSKVYLPASMFSTRVEPAICGLGLNPTGKEANLYRFADVESYYAAVAFLYMSCGSLYAEAFARSFSFHKVSYY
nr:TPA_asm: PC protein [Pecan associated jivivirus 1]